MPLFWGFFVCIFVVYSMQNRKLRSVNLCFMYARDCVRMRKKVSFDKNVEKTPYGLGVFLWYETKINKKVWFL